MKYQLLVKAEAIQDIAEAFEWYENNRAGLGVEFLDEVNEYFERIVQNPGHYQSFRNQRVAIMQQFPFKIVYEVERERIVVFAVYHDKRNPKKLSKRK